MVKQSHTLRSGPSDISSTHLAAHIVIIIWLTTLPVLCFIFLLLYYFVIINFHTLILLPFPHLNPFTFSTWSPNPPLLWQSPLWSLHLRVCFYCLFIYFVHWIPHISEIIWYLSFSVWLISLSITPSRSIHIVSNGKNSFVFMAK